MTDKPKGGRGKKAPYETKQMRVPQPIATQVEALCSRYQEFLAGGGDPAEPPDFLEKLETTEPPVTTKPSKHASAWGELNTRQQAYLRLIFELDQQREKTERSGDWQRFKPRPASEWRWLEYSELFGISSELRRRIKEANLVDPGTGSTFKALSTRKLIEIRYPYGSDAPWLDCKLTVTGRAVARAGLGESAPKKAPKGQLRERQWAALVAAYVAGDGGVKKDENLNYGGFSWEWTWLRLRDYSGGGLIKERDRVVGGKREYRIVITQFGRQYYRSNWQKYRELYPDVDAPEPDRASAESG